MAYVTYDYYSNVFFGESVAETDFPALSARASEIVEELCMYRIREDQMDAYDADTQECVKKAICAQIEYLDANGGSGIDTGNDLQSVGLGKYNYTRSTGTDGTSKQSSYAPRAIRILARTGLLYRGGGCYAIHP